MPVPKMPDDEFIQAFELFGTREMARRYSMDESAIRKRRNRLELKYNRRIICPTNTDHLPPRPSHDYNPRHHIEVPNGKVVVFSDAHYWPDASSTAHRALLTFIKKYRPKAIIANGDVFDGAKMSRHSPIKHENLPSVADELEACRERLGEIEDIAGDAKLIWTLGNHDQRFESKIATHLPELAGVHGVHLKDHFPAWTNAWSCFINNDVVVKHRFKGGMHATHNAPLWAGKSMVTGHLHSLKVTPLTDYNGTRFGVDTGTLSELDHEKFDYGEDNPRNHRSGFIVLTFRDCRLMWPELVHCIEPGIVEFRGKLYNV